MSLRQLGVELLKEVAAVREAGYIEMEHELTLPDSHPLHSVLSGAVVQTQIAVPTWLLKQIEAAEHEETGTS